MKFLLMIKFLIATLLYMGIMMDNIIYAENTDAKLQEIEARLDAILKEQEMNSLESIVKLYNEKKPECFSRLRNYIEKHPHAPDIKRAKKLFAEWMEKKKSELLVHHKGHAGGKWNFYAFAISEDMEKLLKDIAELHGKSNDLNDKYLQVKKAAELAKRNGEINKADQLLQLAKRILDESQKVRKTTNKIFEQLLGGSNKPFYSTTLEGEGMWMNGVTIEFIFFIVEVAEQGKYVRTWTGKVKGGSEITISARNVIISAP